MKEPCVYITTSKARSVIYIGVTSDLQQRMWKHKNGVTGGFVKKYNVNQLVHYERFESMEEALSREKQLEHWEQAWKNQLVTSHNPYWRDLSQDLW
ncbi:GIY-YIG nuclease family protein [Vibrio methylphosphonaticus]|uniref:GIY-YIG nuclease family protein n=1 Tax=Vibrio methylphosphonaticus TaxID=2946866 RepID=UPI00202AAC9C|nr:GIY-YIG nuclease family protein [Vibrio methylphosphonaticus]MCL9775555.1 GIY-YIG nuclease family protein [Vibrio methylphosphonaticus]